MNKLQWIEVDHAIPRYDNEPFGGSCGVRCELTQADYTKTGSCCYGDLECPHCDQIHCHENKQVRLGDACWGCGSVVTRIRAWR